jgi:hypothetical protein
MWHCQQPTSARPGTPNSGWVLCVKTGSRGKDCGEEIRDLTRRVEMLEGQR